MNTFKIIPVLGRKTDVLPDDYTMLQQLGAGIALSHAAGGENWDLRRKKNACVKSFGTFQRSASANAQATQCQGLFELYDGTNREHVFFDNGKIFYFDSSWNPQELAINQIGYNSQTGTFTVGNTLVGGTSGATATIDAVVDLGGGEGTLSLSSITGVFLSDEIIYEASYGSELITNGDFTNWTGDDPDGWTLLFTEDANNYVTEVAGKARFYSSDVLVNVGIKQLILEAGSFYLYSIDVTEIISGIPGLWNDDWIARFYSIGTFTGTFRCNTYSDFDILLGLTTGDWTVDNVSVKKITNAALASGGISSVTFGNGISDFYSAIRVGSYMVFSDNGNTEPYKWQSSDAIMTALAASGTAYKFKYLVPFQRRVIGLYSDQTNGNIDVRWSTDWPATAITALNFPASNQLYIPNDDPISGGSLLGTDKCFIFCENSIQQLPYYPDYTAPFRCFTMVMDQGTNSPFSIVQANGQLYFYNKNLGFCSYNGGNIIVPISDDILSDLNNINSNYYGLIYGKHVVREKKIKWCIPLTGQSFSDYILSYSYDTGQWQFDNITARCLDEWLLFSSMTWSELATALGGATATWADAGTLRWSDFTASNTKTMFGNTDGQVYNIAGESSLSSYREEPILDFGNKRTFKNLLEIWFEIGETGDFSINVYHRGGNTTGELLAQSWDNLGSVSLENPYDCVVKMNKNSRLHQIKWGTDSNDEKYVVNGIVFKYTEGSEL